MPRIEIRRLRSLYEYRECERLQTEVWGNVGVSSEVLSVTQKYGGVVLGAVAKGKLLGSFMRSWGAITDGWFIGRT